MVYLFLAEGFEEIEALTQADYLRRAGIEVKTVGVTGKTVAGNHGIPVVCDMTEKEFSPSGLEMVILPGGIPGVPNLSESKVVYSALKYANDNGRYIAAICAAPTLVAKYGFLDGKRAVCYPGMENQLTGAKYEKKSVVCDGLFITAEAAGASEQFAFAIISALKGKEAAEKVRRSICAR